MTEQNNEYNKDIGPPASKKSAGDELDVAGKSLSEALRISFIILKVIMIILVVAFLASGFKTVGSNERALVLRFGKIQGEDEKRILSPGLKWILPYPIDEIVKIPVETQVNLPIDSFWYFQTKEEAVSGQTRQVRPDKPLNPVLDGYCITRSENLTEAVASEQTQDESILHVKGEIGLKAKINDQSSEFEVELKDIQIGISQGLEQAGSDGSDYNIVHTKWQLTYQIDDPESFFKNIYVKDIKPGDIYFNVITESISPLLENLFEGAVVTAMVNYTIDEAISSRDKIPKDVRKLLQAKLDKIDSGIKVVSVQLTNSECPRQVKDAFEASTRASQKSDQDVTKARTYATNTLNEAAGSVAEELFAALHDENVSEQTLEMLWSQLAGTAQDEIAEARIYRTEVVAHARANADYLESLLPEYRQRPELVIQRIYLDAIEQILNNADEKFVVQTAGGTKGTQLRVLLNRDPSLKPKTTGEEAKTQENQ